MNRIGSVIDGKYEILKQIGKGGMSVVYLAMDKRLNKQWAVKEIRKSGKGKHDEIVVNSLLAEANLMKKLDHPALPRIVDIIEEQDTIFVIMDYIEGESLDKTLKEYGPQPEEVVIEWGKQLCDALSYLHSQKPPIIYRDMKPGNIMLKPEGNLKVIDFGIAREYKEQGIADTTVLGTPGYAPPEQHGSRQTDERSDIFALGMTMHHLLTGVDPRPADYIYAPVRKWKPELSDGIEAIIDKCTQLDPENRYQSCAELMYDLEHPDLITKDFRKKQKRKLGWFLAAAVSGIVLIGAGIGCRVGATGVDNSDYEHLVSVSSSLSLEERVNSYKKAISIYPGKMDAYLKLLEAYEAEGRFSKKENNEFLALYDANKSKFHAKDPKLALLNYRLGVMYFNYYTEEDGSTSEANRVQKAYPFFAANHDNKELPGSFEQKELSEVYYQICSFYKKYILGTIRLEEAGKADYDKLLDTVEEAMKHVETAGKYDRLALYSSVVRLLYDQRDTMATVKVDEKKVLKLLKDVTERAKTVETRDAAAVRLKKEIEKNYPETRKAIQTRYANVKERRK